MGRHCASSTLSRLSSLVSFGPHGMADYGSSGEVETGSRAIAPAQLSRFPGHWLVSAAFGYTAQPLWVHQGSHRLRLLPTSSIGIHGAGGAKILIAVALGDRPCLSLGLPLHLGAEELTGARCFHGGVYRRGLPFPFTKARSGP